MKLEDIRKHAEQIEQFGLDGAIELQGDAVSFAQAVLALVKVAEAAKAALVDDPFLINGDELANALEELEN